MADFINNDTVNNITYMNYFSDISNGEVGTSNTNSTKISKIIPALRLRHGSFLITTDSNSIYAYFNSPNETKTNKTAATNNYRFKLVTPACGFPSNIPAELNSSNISSVGQTIVQPTPITFAGFQPYYEYGITTNNSMSMTAFGASGNDLVTSSRAFISCGWLEDSVFTGVIAVRSLYLLVITAATSQCLRVGAENTTTGQAILTSGNAQYPITCLSDAGDGTTLPSNLSATTLWLRDNPSGYAVGRIPHLLLCKTNTLQLGQLVKINPTIDGITNQKVWLVAANWGGDKILQRVFTEGIS